MPALIIIVAVLALLAGIVIFAGRDTGTWTCHAAPDPPYTLDEAHAVFRAYVECEAAYCHAKAAAMRVLSDHGHLRSVAVR